MSESAPKITIAIGAVTRDSAAALIVTRGLRGEVPLVALRSRAEGAAADGGPATDLICKPLTPGPTIADSLKQADVSVYRVKVPVTSDVVLEARNRVGTATCRSSPFHGLPESLAETPAGLSFVLATCVYYSREDLQRFAARLSGSYGLGAAPSFVLLAGDNVYLDVPKPSGQTPADVVDRYLKYFMDDGYMRARSSMPAFSTFDDHEYWNDFPEREVPVSVWLSEHERPDFERAARECLDLFQRSINPPPVANARYAYQVDVPPVSIFVIDTRSDRDPVSNARRQLMPDGDLQAFETWARELRGPGLLVVGQPLWIDPIMKVGPIAGDHNVSFFSPQYQRICRALEEAPYDILICSGDVHYSRLLRIETRSRRVLHEVVSSPLISIPTTFATFGQYLFGGTPAPSGDTSVSDTTRPPYDGWHATYQTGSGKCTVFAVLNLQRSGSGVSVGLSFIDMRTGQPAELTPHSPLGPAQFLNGSNGRTCFHPRALRLDKKLPL